MYEKDSVLNNQQITKLNQAKTQIKLWICHALAYYIHNTSLYIIYIPTKFLSTSLD